MDKYLAYEQQGVKYNLYDMPEGFKFLKTVDLSYQDLEELPDLSKCVCMAGFKCSHNALKTLKGAPKEVYGDFDASCCQLENTEGISQKIDGTLNLALNNLQKIDKFPEKVAEDVLLDRNPLESLAGLSTAEIGKKIYADDGLLQKYNAKNRSGCTTLDDLSASPVFRAESRAAGLTADKVKLKTTKTGGLDAVKRQEKWHRLKMSCITDNCPKVDGKGLFDMVSKASEISCHGHTPVYVECGAGFAIPADTKFYDACFMALQQTDIYDPEDRLAEAEHIHKAAPGVKLPKDTEIRIAYYLNEVISKNPERAMNVSAEVLAEAYPILRQMEVSENKVALPAVEKELQQRFPEKWQDLQRKNPVLSNPPSRNI